MIKYVSGKPFSTSQQVVDNTSEVHRREEQQQGWLISQPTKLPQAISIMKTIRVDYVSTMKTNWAFYRIFNQAT